MFKIIMPIKRKAGLTRQEFIDAYENRMVPLINRHVGKYLQDYKRNYVIANDPHSFGQTDAAKSSSRELPRGGGRKDPSSTDIDVVTELLLKDRAALDAMFAIVNSPAVSAEIAADAHQFIDMQSARRYITEVYPRTNF